MDKFTQSIVELEFEQSAYLDQIEEGTSSVRSGFDAKAHADKLLAHPTFQTNHLSYGLKSAQKRQDKGTFDTELNKKMGKNLANIGASRVGEKYNAAEQRAVGEHIANHIAKKVGAIKESVEQIDEALPDWAADEFTKAFPKKTKSAAAHDDEVSSWNDKTDGKYKIQKFAKGRVVTGKRASGYDAGEDNEKEVQSPVGKSTVAKDHPWLPKPVAAPVGAKKVSQGVMGQKAGKVVSAERQAALKARELRSKGKFKAEAVEQIDERAVDTEAHASALIRVGSGAKAKTWGHAVHDKAGAKVMTHSDPVKAMNHAKQIGGTVKRVVREGVEDLDEMSVNPPGSLKPKAVKTAGRTSMAAKGITGVKASDFFAAMKGKSKDEVNDIMAKRKEAIARVRKEGMMYHYDIQFEEGIIHSGKAVTEAAANRQAERFINMMIETYESMPEPLEVHDILRIGKTLASNK